ncbi:MAG TPA: pantoate--beta-alanine ligase, partial [Flavisolibacter sp.]|nr:pantoate--beta-alanine ligase [Flavisolibacter sp.]
ENDLTVCSIFVNPTQFNNPEDFQKYPKTLEKDIELLIGADCDILFLPTKEEIYPADYVAPYYDLGYLENILEGAHRPGHFQGVCQVVDLLLNIVQPDNFYLGQKDYQQCMVLSRLVEIRGSHEQIHYVPTKREESGLAMSSRNLRLNDSQRELATSIYQVLQYLKANIGNQSIADLQQSGWQQLEAKGFTVDYVAICNAKTLKESQSKEEPLVGLIAASLDTIRLIDNLRLN